MTLLPVFGRRRLRAAALRARHAADWTSAVECYRALVRQGAATAEDRLQLADALKEQGDIAAAEQAYWTTAAAFPRHCATQAAYGRFLLSVRRYELAANALARALALDPSDVSVQADLAGMGIVDDAHDAALLNGILAGQAVPAKRRDMIGRIMVALGLYQARRHARARRWSAAAAVYGRLVSAEPDNQPLRIQWGHALREQGDAAGAVAAYRNALVGRPYVADVYLHLGQALKMLGRGTSAFQSFLVAWRLQPGLPAAAAELRSAGWNDQDLARIAQQTWRAPGMGAVNGATAGTSSTLVMPDGLTSPQRSIWLLLAAHVGNRN